MKSLLVDALRQASDRNRDVSPEAAAGSDGIAVEPARDQGEENVTSIDELELVEPEDDVDAHAGRIDTEVAEITSEAAPQTSRPDFAASQNQSPAAIGNGVGKGREHTRSFERYAVWTPLVCILLCTSAAGFYSVWNDLVGDSTTSDLRSLPTQNPAESRADNGELLITSPVRFPFARNKPVMKRMPAISSPVVESAARASQQAQITLSKHQASSFERGVPSDVAMNEPSFTTLAAAYQSYRIGEISGAAFESILADRAKQDAAATSSEIKLLLQRYADAAPLHFALGNLYANTADWAEARVAFAQATEIDADNSSYLFNLAVSLERLGRYDEAGPLYDSAMRLAKTGRPTQ